MKRVRYDMVGKATMTVKTIIPGIVMVLMGLLSIGNNGEVYATISTLTLTIDSATVRADVAPTNPQGTFSKTTGSTITASTDNATGYTLSISAPTSAGSDYDKLINTTDNTAKLNSISSPTTEEQYKALNATSYNNTWGYLPSRYCSDGTSNSCATNTSFLPAPTTTGDILDQTTSANSTANTYTIGMGTRIDSSIKTGQYTNSFVVKLVANAIPYTIIYDDNVVSNMPTDISSTTPDSTVNIASNTPVRAGYTFLGWCTVAPTNNNGTDACTGGTQYQPSATLTIDQTGTGNSFHLYAMWKEEKTIANSTYLQEVTSCPASLTTGQVYTVKDSRDNQEYKVAKLADGKCWMVENLNLAGGTALSVDNTDVTSAYISSFTTSNNLTKNGDTIVLPASDTAGFDTNNYSYVNNSGNTTNCGVSGQNTPCYSYYSWDAATLGSGRTIATENTDAPYSVCPKGWRLPTSRTTSATNWQTESDFYVLAHQYGLDSTTSTSESDDGFYTQAGPGTTPNFLLAGFYGSGGSFYSGGSSGFYWSSTSSSGTFYASGLYFHSSYVSSASQNNRVSGFSVRCLFSGP